MSDRYFQHTFPNGLTLLAENMPGMQSAAFSFVLPAGSVTDPANLSGSATVLSDLVLRGAGQRDSRQLTDELDRLGLQRSNSVSVYHSRFGCAALSDKVLAGLPLYADIIRRPHLPESGFAAARDLALQSLAGIDDEPRQKLLIKLRERHLAHPYGVNSMGTKESLERLTLETCKTGFQRHFQPNGSIMAVAGNIDFKQWKDAVEKYFGDWAAGTDESIVATPPPRKYFHEKQESEQTHIGIAYDSILETDPDYYTVRLAIEILSGGMSGRLFTEVREKRALCYSVWAGYMALKDHGDILGYAGTSNERAQATLDCFLGELDRLSNGVTQAELDRAKTGLKASTIMQGESTSSRAGALTHDWFMRGRLRTLDEIKSAINAVSLDAVNAYLASHKPGSLTIVTVGPKELTIPA